MTRLLFTLLIALFSLNSNATENSYLNQLIAASHEQQLAQNAGWWSLLHYRKAVLGGYPLSEADDERFFFSAEGSRDAELELAATLSAFFTPLIGDLSEHPQCRFPARYYWLSQQLDIATERLPQPPCDEFNQWMETINPGSATLVFPAAYLNSPSSMFGHTLLRIDPADKRSETPLISYALNYAAAITGEENGFVFAYKGIFGGYPGSFALVPYYEKIKEYSDMENRNIWEYQLNLSGDEVRQLMRHTWEVSKIRFDYYFFDENCSYRLLTLLDVARPGLGLAEPFSATAIPADTVRAVEQKNLFSGINYRPSTTTTLNHRLNLLDESQQRQLLMLITDDTAHQQSEFLSLNESLRAKLLELAYDLQLYRIRASGLQRDPRASHAYQLLSQRSKLASSAEWPEVPIPGVRAEQGHLSSRIALSLGSREKQLFTALRYRPAYHDILDPAQGYGVGMQINFSDLNLRYYPEEQRVEIEEWKIINILSLSPRNDFFQPISWGIDLGFQRQRFNGQSVLPLQVTGEAGVSYRLGKQWLASTLAQLQFAAHHDFDEKIKAGVGPNLKLLYHSNQVHSLLLVQMMHFPQGDEYQTWQLNWQLNLPLPSEQQGLRFSAKREWQEGNAFNEFEIAWQWYF
ncbi:MAG: DUF4105 domain-containing protein [Gammaproteobacteria bacterium]|nr:DUF4105 domain-containing protein [Gammaproteobacteria bacterium]